VNTLAIRRIMFAVDDIAEALARLQARGTDLVAEMVQSRDAYRPCLDQRAAAATEAR
jgi:hypothetical protein